MDLVTLIMACSLYSNNSIPYAIIQTHTHKNPLVVSVDDRSHFFKTTKSASQFAQKKIAQGKAVAMGLMQISSRELPEVAASIPDLFRPCKNLVLATQILEKLRLKCQALAAHQTDINIEACTLSLYKTGGTEAGLNDARQIIHYAKRHPFDSLLEKARDPAMVAASKKPKDPLLPSTEVPVDHAGQLPIHS